jgi:hypothetical protein
MRIWNLKPSLLDSKGLGAAWREALLAKSILIKLNQDPTRKVGYGSHAQLIRFKRCPYPIWAIQALINDLYAESLKRGYHYNPENVEEIPFGIIPTIPITRGQIRYEWNLLATKIANRAPKWFGQTPELGSFQYSEEDIKSPLVTIVESASLEFWEREKNIPSLSFQAGDTKKEPDTAIFR